MTRFIAVFAAFSLFFSIKTAAQESEAIETEASSWRTETSDRPQMDSIGNPDSLSEEQLRQWGTRLDQQADLLKKGFERELQYATYKRENLLAVIRKLKKDEATPDTVYLANTILFSKARQSEKEWKSLVERAKKCTSNTARLQKMPLAGLRRAVLTNESEIRQLLADGNSVGGNRPKSIGPAVARPADPVATKPPAPTQKPATDPIAAKPEKPATAKPTDPVAIKTTDPALEKNTEPTDPKTADPIAQKPPAPRQKATKLASDYKKYSRSEDPLFSPPATKCRFANQSKDEFSGAINSEVVAEPFFTFTNTFMKNHLGDKPHIVCAVHLLGVSNGAKYIQLSIQVNEGSAKRSFGGLNRGNKMTIKFIDGSVIQLENARTDEGEVNDTDNFTTFRGLYLIDGKEQLSAIKKREIDRIRVGWNTGFEDYEVYNVDVLKRQAGCLF